MGDDMNRILTTHLTLNGPIPDKVKKLSQIFIFTLLCGASKGFMKAFKAFIKPFDTPQRSVKIKLTLIFSLRPGLGREGLKC